MKTEVRFLLAIVLMIVILVGTNLLFPPIPPDPELADETPAGEVEPGTDPADPTAPALPGDPADTADPDARPDTRPRIAEDPELPGARETPGATDPDIPADERAQEAAEEGLDEAGEAFEEERVTVEGPRYRYVFSNIGAQLRSVELLNHVSFTRDGPVELIPEDGPGAGALAHRVLIGSDTIDFGRLPFEMEPADGLRLEAGQGPDTLRFVYRHPTGQLSLEIDYVFDPDSYVIQVSGRVGGVGRGVLFTDLGPGLAFNEEDPEDEARSMAFVANHRQEGVISQDLVGFTGREVVDGPFFWVAFKSKYFLMAMLAGETNGTGGYLGGLIAREGEVEHHVDVEVTQSLGSDGRFTYQLFAGPQDRALLADVGYNLTEVNPIGWRFFRPIIRPFVAVTIWVLVFLHENLSLGYGWVLILFGLMMRVLLFPLNHKAMRAQLRNMAVQPLLKDIQTRYKDQPERLQKELMKLYKEHGFNPLAGCWPMLLPWPVLIALFFVFQNTIELRGVPFMWLPDLAAQDPLYILPVLLGISMFFLQWVSFRTMQEVNPQMKMMMWLMPIFMVFIFYRLPSGLNLYYVTANIATLPQTYWIAQERVKAQAKGPLVPASGEPEDEEAAGGKGGSGGGGDGRGGGRGGGGEGRASAGAQKGQGRKGARAADAGAGSGAGTGGGKGSKSRRKRRK